MEALSMCDDLTYIEIPDNATIEDAAFKCLRKIAGIRWKGKDYIDKREFNDAFGNEVWMD
jgi:hypothetical protein